MVKLQKPKFVYMDGKLRLWDEATLHVGSEAVLRGLNVFEGVRGYWQPDGSFGLVKLRPHYERLCRSARLLYLPFSLSYEEYKEAIRTLCEALLQPGRDMWFRTTLFGVQGHWGEDTVADLIITGYQAEMSVPPAFDLGVSTWRRSEDVALPSRVKTGTNYQVGRLARIEGRIRGCQDMVLLNKSGRASEATAACLLVVRNGKILTAPASEGALESITAEVMEVLAKEAGIPFECRPIDRTELLIANEIGLCGTMDELRIAKTIDGLPLSAESPILRQLQSRYLKAVRGVEPHPFIDLTTIHPAAK
jgi:branched-chain amino acid aminotransferase